MTDSTWIRAYNGKAVYADNIIYSASGLRSDGYVVAKGSSASSDIRLKNILGDITLPTRVIADAPNKLFTWKDDAEHKRNAGTIAQYWLNVLPEVVRTDDKGFYSIKTIFMHSV